MSSLIKTFFRAAANDDVDKIAFCLKNDIDIESKNEFGVTALYVASEVGAEAVVKRLLKHNADVQAVGYIGYTALHRAARNGYSKIVDLLLNAGAKTNVPNELDGGTPLNSAVMHGHDSIVKTLLRRGAHIESMDRNRFTPLHLAAFKGHMEVIM